MRAFFIISFLVNLSDERGKDDYFCKKKTRMTTSISSEAFEKKEHKVKESKIIQWTKKNNE